MVNPFILQVTDAMTRIILGMHTLLLGTGGRGCGGPGIRTITATGCRERDTPTCTGAAHAEVAASADMAKMPYRTFFITISLH